MLEETFNTDPPTTSKVTSKLQVTIPKALANRYGIRPGDEIGWEASGNILRVIPPGRGVPKLELAERVRLFEASRARQRRREASGAPRPMTTDRGWSREELYERGSSR